MTRAMGPRQQAAFAAAVKLIEQTDTVASFLCELLPPDEAQRHAARMREAAHAAVAAMHRAVAPDDAQARRARGRRPR